MRLTPIFIAVSCAVGFYLMTQEKVDTFELEENHLQLDKGDFSVDLTPYLDNTDDQTVSIEESNWVIVGDEYITNESIGNEGEVLYYEGGEANWVSADDLVFNLESWQGYKVIPLDCYQSSFKIETLFIEGEGNHVLYMLYNGIENGRYSLHFFGDDSNLIRIIDDEMNNIFHGLKENVHSLNFLYSEGRFLIVE